MAAHELPVFQARRMHNLLSAICWTEMASALLEIPRRVTICQHIARLTACEQGLTKDVKDL